MYLTVIIVLPCSVHDYWLIFVQESVVQPELLESPLHQLLKRLARGRLHHSRDQSESMGGVVKGFTWN